MLSLFLASYLTVTPGYSSLLNRPQNPLALNSSPYGMLLSSLLQQPINEAWHKGVEIHETKDENEEVHDDHDHKAEHDAKAAVKSSHHHEEGDKCEICDTAAGRFGDRANKSLLTSLSQMLGKLEKKHLTRTNPKPISPAHKLYIAQSIEKKLLLAYNLDPTNYAAYDAYYLFLTENVVAGLGSAEKIKQAQLITQRTFELSNREKVNPLPALSAALATFNRFMLNLSLGKPKDDNFNRMLYVEVSRQLVKYDHLKEIAVSAGDWELVPEAWKLQADQRAHFLRRLAQDLAGKPAGKTLK